MNNVLKLTAIFVAATGTLALEAAQVKTAPKPYADLVDAIKKGDLKKVQAIVPSKIPANKILKQTPDQIRRGFKPESLTDFAGRYNQPTIVQYLQQLTKTGQAQQKSAVATASSSSAQAPQVASSSSRQSEAALAAKSTADEEFRKLAYANTKAESPAERIAHGILMNDPEFLIDGMLIRNFNPILFSNEMITKIEKKPYRVGQIIYFTEGFDVNSYQYAKYLYDRSCQQEQKEREELLGIIAEGIPQSQRAKMEKELQEKLKKSNAL